MRIIGGEKKGGKIILPYDKNTRPLKDILKESLFNILTHSNILKFKFENSNILDLFSGVGSFGIECLSRGANKVVFFENYKKTSKILKKNISIFKYKNKSEIFEKDIYEKSSLLSINGKFNLIFMDLPFKEKRILDLLEMIKKHKILDKNGLVILHRHVETKDVLPTDINILIEKKYGKSKVIIAKF
tara:strand:+ start:994 stop:1554 length:561 start_codon:yes stop_codon:yes gene_type:complete